MENWKPGFWKHSKDGLGLIWVDYEKRWFCNTNKIIHQSVNEYINCKDCNPKNKIKQL